MIGHQDSTAVLKGHSVSALRLGNRFTGYIRYIYSMPVSHKIEASLSITDLIPQRAGLRLFLNFWPLASGETRL